MPVSSPIYYLPSQLHFTGDSLNPVDAGAGVEAAFFQALSDQIPQNAPAGFKPLYFIVQTLAGAQSTVEINLEFDGNGGVRLSDSQDPFYDIAESATLNLLMVGIAAIPVIANLPVLAIAAGVGVVTTLYNSYLSDSVYEIYETIQGTVDTDIQLKNASGDLLSGVLYKDGIADHELPYAVQQLLISSTGNPEYPIPTDNDRIEIYRGASNQFSDIFEVYGGIAERAAEIFFAGNVGDFSEFDGNENYYLEVGAGTDFQRLIIARTFSNSAPVTPSSATDLVAVPDYYHGGIRYFQPKNIYAAKNGHVEPNQLDNADRLYLGDGLSSAGAQNAFYSSGGNDFMYGGGGSDELHGGGGDDVLFGDYGSALSDLAFANQYSGDDLLYGGAGDDVLIGGANTDTNSQINEYEDILHLSGDTASYRDFNLGFGVYVNMSINSKDFDLGSYTITVGSGKASAINHYNETVDSIDTLIGIENIEDSIGDDIIIGDHNSNVFMYSGGSDYYEGGAGIDYYFINTLVDGAQVHIDETNLGPNFIFMSAKQSAYDYSTGYHEGQEARFYEFNSSTGKLIVTGDASVIFADNTGYIDGTVGGRFQFNGGVNRLQVNTRSNGGSGQSTVASYSVNSTKDEAEEKTDVSITFTHFDGSKTDIVCGIPWGAPYDSAYGEEDNTTIMIDGIPSIWINNQGEVFLYPEINEISAFRLDGNVYNFFVSEDDYTDLYGDLSAELPQNNPNEWGATETTYSVMSGDVTAVYSAYIDAQNTGSPLVLDIDADGIELVSKDNSTVFWDIDNDGFAELTGWVSPDDGLLAIDLDGDGFITSHDELFGSISGDGFTELLTFDTNTDGVIDANDTDFDQLLVWQDTNQNGIGAGTELSTLSELNITSISLSSTVQNGLEIAGNPITHTGTYVYDDGVNPTETRDIYDVWFDYENMHTLYDGDVVLDPHTLELPNFSGYGNLSGLQIAMSLDNDIDDPNSLLSLVRSLHGREFIDLFDDGAINEAIKDIMFRWAGVDGLDPSSRGLSVDARELEFIETFVGQSYLQGGASPDPGSLAGQAVARAFALAELPIIGRIISQLVADDLFVGDLEYNAFTDKFSGVTGVQQTALDALVAKSNDGNVILDKAEFWKNVIKVIDHSVGVDTLDASTLTQIEAALQASDTSLSIDNILDKIQHDISSIQNWVSDGEAIVGTHNGDVYNGSVGDDGFIGGSGDDIINGDLGDDSLRGGGGNDVLNGQLGNDILQGEGGDDIYTFEAGHGTDTVYDISGNDKIIFGDGVVESDLTFTRTSAFDVQIDINSTYGAGVILIPSQITSPGGLIETIEFSDGSTVDQSQIDYVTHGTSANDSISGVGVGYGGSGNDTIYGYDGNDAINGFATYGGYSYTTQNYLYGGNGNDIINGDHGDDELFGENNNDDINANNGNDIIDGGTGNDYLKGGVGADTYIFEYGDGGDVISELFGDGAVDRISFGAGITQEMISVERFGGYDFMLTIDGGLGGTILLNYQINYSAYYVIEEFAFADGTVISNFDEYLLEGKETAETLYGVSIGGSGVDIIHGNGGNDNIYAYYSAKGTNENFLYGGAGNDNIYGENGNDTLEGGTDNDTLSGYLGDDTYVWSAGDGNDVINETGGADQLVLHGVLESDIYFEKISNIHLKAHIGSETITINYQMYEDTYNYSPYNIYQVENLLLDDGTIIDLTEGLTFGGTAANDTVAATYHHDDILFGFDGNDTLYGYGGDDILHGGDGVDTLHGGGGADTFVFEGAGAFVSVDTVQDFKLSENDKIDVSDLLSGYDPLTDAISDFIQITDDGTHSTLSVDADGGADNFVNIATLLNATGLTDEEALETSGNLIAA